MAKKSLGQHFLRNKSAIRAIVTALPAAAGDIVVEIGPGHGELTEQLRAANPNLTIIAIEKDSVLCADLRKKIIDSQTTFIEGDVLRLLPELIADDSRFTNHEWDLVGNIPYYITGHLLRVISEMPEKIKPRRCIFTIQREVAERIMAPGPTMNRLAASVAYWADAKIIMNLSQEDFVPAPKVASAIILLNHKEKSAFKDQDRYYEAVRALFSQPRKIILNNLSQAGAVEGSPIGKYSKEELAASLQNIGVLPESRPQDLSIENIAKIAEVFF
jgi:16S rRNA (adenine1518-N6/adenine1519-N6)-dimethyltransferase